MRALWMVLIPLFLAGTSHAQQVVHTAGNHPNSPTAQPAQVPPPSTDPAAGGPGPTLTEEQRISGQRARPRTPAMMAGATKQTSDSQLIQFQVAMPSNTAFTAVRIDLLRLGQSQDIVLTDDGTNPSDVAYDGIWEGQHKGSYARYVTIRMFGADESGGQTLLYSGVERTEDKSHATLGWRVIQVYDTLTAMRTPDSYPGNVTEVHVSIPLVTGFGWGIFVLVYIGLAIPLVRRENGE